ncbi:protein MULTIPOLAR SPINDLE 1 [Hevea brasiliensis]|uniref:protein MULTIPOLAR SPINDLE 1 n=1 Tax=Hevea brasiliensis TaxID=3981 RepID=UPI0025EE4554|nr:protein MULTIPOLAR SPINDLE 1 [Hevea brasiliensis]
MIPTEQASNTNAESTSDQSLKLAVAISLLRSKRLQRQAPLPDPPLESDALRWKRKAKERKQELIRLRENLKEAEDASHCDLFPQSASCKCYFFDNLGKLSPKRDGDGFDRRFNDVLRRRFLRQVRLKERRRTDAPKQRLRLSDLSIDAEVEQLRASIDFLVELCDSASPGQTANFANWSHQAVDFILASLRNLLSAGKNLDFTEDIVNSLIMRLGRRMCSPSQGDESQFDTDAQFYIQHLIRKLGSESYIGQRAILSVSQKISVVAENMLFMDPFDNAFPNIHRCLYIMIQLIEFLVSDYLLSWSKDEGFDNVLFEEWVTSLLHARKALELLESRNGLYVIYMDRVLGQLAKQVGQVSLLPKLNQEILDNLFC